ncbi:MAG TPA: toxic anion resistance protein [Selenomonas sp.]|nr:toxic anion resistance protein [Selenomonadaceae bacterium]HCB93122.1 toxic anion resistance protein [Selenomonas sp.]
MAELSLEDLMKGRKQENTSVSLEKVEPEKEIARVTEQVEILSPEEQRRVAEIKDKIDLMDTGTSLTFGSAAQKEIADFSNSILSHVRVKDGGPVGELLGDLVTRVKGFEPSESGGFFKKLPIVGSLVSKAEDMLKDYEKLSVQVDKIQGGLERSKVKMMEDVVMFDGLYEKNLAYFKELQLYIRAGEEKLQEMRDVTLPRLRQEAAASNDPMAVQVVADFESSVDRFEKKVYDLKISKTLAIQTAPQIRLIQNNDRVLIDRVQTAIYNTIPLWKSQMVIALGLSRQQQVLDMQRAVTDTTNELLKRNAKMLKQTTVETARENERGIVDIETVKQVNEDLISTIEETMRIQAEGRAKRQAAEQELVAIEGRLRQALLDNSNRK